MKRHSCIRGQARSCCFGFVPEFGRDSEFTLVLNQGIPPVLNVQVGFTICHSGFCLRKTLLFLVTLHHLLNSTLFYFLESDHYFHNFDLSISFLNLLSPVNLH